MDELVRFTVGDHDSVVVEVTGGARATGPAGLRPGSIRDLGEAFERRLGQVRDAAVAALDTLRAAGDPDEITLSFGVKLTAEAGAVIARTSVEGQLAVEMVWRRP